MSKQFLVSALYRLVKAALRTIPAEQVKAILETVAEEVTQD